MSSLLKFGKGNAKLIGVGKTPIYTFSLPSGYTCPFALDCLSKANKVTGKIKDGPETKFRCFSASQEALYRNVRDSRWANFNALLPLRNSVSDMMQLILDSLPKKAEYVRIHVGGDFFNKNYFAAWALAANERRDTVFYAYTKSLSYWVELRKNFSSSPCLVHDMLPNFRLTASYGGSQDKLIAQHGLRFAKVVFSEKEAELARLPIDHDDSHAIEIGDSFALLLHGTQPKGTIAAKSLSALHGKGSYSKKGKAKS